MALEMAHASRRDERPAETRVEPAPRLLAERFFRRGVDVQLSENQLARREREHGRDTGADDQSRSPRHEASDARSDDEREDDPEKRGSDAAHPLAADVRVPGDEEGGEEVRVEPLLIGDERPRQQPKPSQRRRELRGRTKRRANERSSARRN
jgi:hypothetical protein